MKITKSYILVTLLLLLAGINIYASVAISMPVSQGEIKPNDFQFAQEKDRYVELKKNSWIGPKTKTVLKICSTVGLAGLVGFSSYKKTKYEIKKEHDLHRYIGLVWICCKDKWSGGKITKHLRETIALSAVQGAFIGGMVGILGAEYLLG